MAIQRNEITTINGKKVKFLFNKSVFKLFMSSCGKCEFIIEDSCHHDCRLNYYYKRIK